MTAQPHLTVETVDIATLTPDPTNARKHDRRNLDSIAGSLRQFGQRKPIVVTAAGTVLAGNGTLAAARELGWSEIAVVRTPADWDDDRAKAYALADNRTAELAAWDDEVLGAQLVALDNAGWDLAEIGFDRADQASQIEDTEDDEVPAPPAEPRAKLGDVWQVGPHRIVCGDSTDESTVQRLLEQQRPHLVFMDPPYGIAYKAMRGGKAIANDGNASDALNITKGALALVVSAEAVFACCDWRSLATMVEAFRACSLEPKACIVWDKETRVQNLDRFAKQHELILYAGPYGGHPTFSTDVWRYRRDFDPDHPTPKPVGLVAHAIQSSSSPGDLVVDPFAGSGSTLVAAARTGRIGRGVELDPGYVDVIVRRLEAETGLIAELVTDGSAG